MQEGRDGGGRGRGVVDTAGMYDVPVRMGLQIGYRSPTVLVWGGGGGGSRSGRGAPGVWQMELLLWDAVFCCSSTWCCSRLLLVALCCE